MCVNNKIASNNSRILALFLFQYSLIIPITHYIENWLGVAIISSVLLFLLFLKNIRNNINIAPVLLLLLVFMYILTNTILLSGNIMNLLMFMTIAIPTSVVTMYKFNSDQFIKSCCSLAYVNFFINCFYPFIPGYAYMRFGYGMLITSVFLYIKIRNRYNLYGKQKRHDGIFDMIVLFLSLIDIVLFGARGAIFAFLLLLFLDLFISSKNILRNIALSIVPLSLIAVSLEPVVNALVNFTKANGYFSYTLFKIQMQLSYGIENASSGRNTLYKKAIDGILEHPFLGRGIFLGDADSLYTHNLFLQVGNDLGVLPMCLLICFLIVILYEICSKKNPALDRVILLALFSIAIGRLMFSSNIWLRPEFWLLTFVYISKKCSWLVNSKC